MTTSQLCELCQINAPKMPTWCRVLNALAKFGAIYRDNQ
jgi:hypothetical protein